jgi:hypothetical protein
LDGVSYAASALCLAFVRSPPEPHRALAAGSMVQDLRKELSAFASRRWLWLVIGQFGLLNLVALAPFMVLAPVILAKAPDAAQHWGSLLSAVGVGGVAGAAAVMRWPPSRAVLAIECATIMLVTPLILLAVHATLPLLLVGGAAYGGGAAIVNVMIGTSVQREIPVELLSRVFSIIQIAAGTFAPLGDALAGPASAWLGPDLALGTGAAAALASVAILLSFKDVRRFGENSAAPPIMA